MSTPISQLRDVTCHIRSHSVTCRPTQVNAPALTPASKLVLDFPTPKGLKAELGLQFETADLYKQEVINA